VAKLSRNHRWTKQDEKQEEKQLVQEQHDGGQETSSWVQTKRSAFIMGKSLEGKSSYRRYQCVAS